MLNCQTYTPPEGEASTAILPLLPDHLRRQLLAELARLLEMARSIGKSSAGEAGDNLNITRKHIRVPKSKERVEFATRTIWP